MFRFTRALLACAGAASLLLATGVPATAATTSGSDTRIIPSHSVFAPDSPFYQKLPADSPEAPDSPELVASLNEQAHEYYGTETEANLSVNTQKFAPALYVAYNTDPVFNVIGWNCQGKQTGWDTEFNRIMTGVHIPADMLPDPSSDGSVSIYNPDSNDIVELWQARKVGDGSWQACWGGRILNVDESLGVHGSGYGASASGIALWAGTIRAAEFLNGRIDHVISLGIPRTKAESISWPANRTDGGTIGTELSIGQMLRLPAGLDLTTLKLSPSAMTIAKAAQEYGIIITDTSGAVIFSGENSIALATNPYPTIFRSRWSSQEMAARPGLDEVAFPLDKLVALPISYKVPIAAAPIPEGTNTAYPAAVKAANPFTYWRLDDTKTTAADLSGGERTGTIAGVTQSEPGAIAGSTAIRTLGTSSSSVYRTAVTLPPRNFSAQVWFNTTSTTGGKLFGRENTMTGLGTSFDRSLYLANDGRLVFGTYVAPKLSTIASTASYNDGTWHMATATQGTDGTKLYVDGDLVGSGTATGAQDGYGYWRLGGGNVTGWPLQPSSPWFTGAVDEFAVYHSMLTAATIATQYAAAERPVVPAVPNTAYPAAVKAANPFTYWRLDDTRTTAADLSGSERTGTIAGVTQSVPGAIAGNTAIRTLGTSSSSVYRTAVTLPPKTFTVQVWFNTTSTTGGKLLGRENTMTGLGTAFDRSLYLADDGRLLFGTYVAPKLSTVSSTTSYNDGAWHLATATQGADGTKLYVDGALVASGTATSAQDGYGYWRLGGGNLKGWTLAPTSSWFAGGLDEFAVYHTTLSAATIAAQYAAAA